MAKALLLNPPSGGVFTKSKMREAKRLHRSGVDWPKAVSMVYGRSCKSKPKKNPPGQSTKKRYTRYNPPSKKTNSIVPGGVSLVAAFSASMAGEAIAKKASVKLLENTSTNMSDKTKVMGYHGINIAASVAGGYASMLALEWAQKKYGKSVSMTGEPVRRAIKAGSIIGIGLKLAEGAVKLYKDKDKTPAQVKSEEKGRSFFSIFSSGQASQSNMSDFVRVRSRLPRSQMGGFLTVKKNPNMSGFITVKKPDNMKRLALEMAAYSRKR